MNNKPIGIFDSGLGGLTAVRELKAELPNEDIIYFGDTGRVPYGTRSNDTIRKYANQDIKFLKSFDVKYIIAACGTVSAVLSDEIQGVLGNDFTGVLIPASQIAVKATKSGKIGVIGTSASINSGAYSRKIKELNPEFQVFEKSCPLFVPLVENGYFNKENEVARLVAIEYLKPLIEMDIDTLILGCTHYPILKDLISSIVGEHVTLIDPGFETAKVAAKYLKENDLLTLSNTSGDISYYVSDSIENFAQNAGVFMGEDVKNDVKRVDIDLL